jgi:MscS family membrane protein
MRIPVKAASLVAALIPFLGFGPASVAQIPGISPPAAPAPEKPEDPLGRQTPRKSLSNFLKAAEAGKYDVAAEFLDMTPSQRRLRGAKAAKELQAVLNAGYSSRIMSVSDHEQGRLDDGLPPDRDSAGEIVIADSAVSLTMVRQDGGPEFGHIWLISRETMREVPELSHKIPAYAFAESLPEQLHLRFRGMALYQWLGVLLFFVLAFFASWLLVRLGVRVARRLGASIGGTPWPLVAVLALYLHSLVLQALQVPLLYRTNYSRFVGVFILIGLAWLLIRAVDAGSEAAQQRALLKGNLSAGSWIVMARRLLKVLVVSIAVLVLLAGLGFNVTTALAGLGIGGIAIGFGAQKTIENLFGGISVATDQVIRVGDTCDFGGRIGVVTDIGLRSTRMKTLERTELSIPNGVLANMNVDNLSQREKMLLRTTFGLLYRTTPEQVENVLAGIRELFAADPRVEWPGGRVNFIAFAESSLNIEIFCYILTPDFNEFMQIREELLLKIMKIVETAGTGFAFPSRTVYVRKDTEGALAEAAAPAEADAE